MRQLDWRELAGTFRLSARELKEAIYQPEPNGPDYGQCDCGFIHPNPVESPPITEFLSMAANTEQPNPSCEPVPESTPRRMLTAPSRNGRARSGPKTPQGKAAVARNAISHGIFATPQVIPGVEQVEDWEAHVAGILASVGSDDYLDTVLARRAADLLWRLERYRRHEAAAVGIDQAQVERQLARLLTERAARRGLHNSYQCWNERELDDAVELTCARQILLEKLADSTNETSVLLVVARDLLVALATQVGVDMRDPALAPITVETAPGATQPSTTTAELRKAIASLAARADRDPQAILVTAVEHARERERILRELKEWATAQRKHLQEVHLLPNAERLQQLMRYEAHLARQLDHTLHELEVRQARRRGERVHVGRVHWTGGPDDSLACQPDVGPATGFVLQNPS